MRYVLGIALIVISLLCLAVAVCQVTPVMYVDFPCQAGLSPGYEVNPDTRIAYCISIWPLRAISGGAIYAAGSASQDTVTAGILKLERQGQILVVNGQRLAPGETYRKVQWRPSVNPWLIFTFQLVVRNDGVLEDVLYISGDVYEGWVLNPLGTLILVGGIWLTVQGARERRRRLCPSD